MRVHGRSFYQAKLQPCVISEVWQLLLCSAKTLRLYIKTISWKASWIRMICSRHRGSGGSLLMRCDLEMNELSFTFLLTNPSDSARRHTFQACPIFSSSVTHANISETNEFTVHVFIILMYRWWRIYIGGGGSSWRVLFWSTTILYFNSLEAGSNGR